MADNLDRKLRLPRIHFRVILHAANMRHGTNGFTSLPKEGVLRIFFALKNPTASAGFEPAATSRPPTPLPSALTDTIQRSGMCRVIHTDWTDPVYNPVAPHCKWGYESQCVSYQTPMQDIEQLVSPNKQDNIWIVQSHLTSCCYYC